ncbi:MAG TPA: hypothetical protein ENN05_03525 [Deltaproteobacteria bacterium]|nr:hypothetical protein [Deltaproteobacteria bacterium]
MPFRLIVLVIIAYSVLGWQGALAGCLNLSPVLLYESGEEDYSIKMAGPILEFSSERIALRPLLHIEEQGTDILYPLGKNTSSRGLFFPVYSSRVLENSMHRTLFPFFHGSYMNTSYAGLFPVYGKFYHRFGYDESHFFLWPVYSSTTYDTIRTHNILWPVFSYCKDRTFKIFPLYGYKKNLESRHDFLLWPIFHHIRGPRNMDAMLFLFQRSYGDNYESTSILWPFFTLSRDFQAQHTSIDAPWPLIRYAKGGYEEIRIFPLYHKKIIPGTYSMKTIGWPLYKNELHHDHNGELRRHKTTILILSNHSYTINEMGQEETDTTLWPIWYQSKTSNGFSWHFPWILPLDDAGYKNNWLPILTLARSIDKDGTYLIDILWHTLHYHRDEMSSRLALSFLYSYETGVDYRQIGFFFDLINISLPTDPRPDNRK